VKPLQIYTVIPHNASASLYYRMKLPIDTAAALGLNIRATIDTFNASVPAEDRVRGYCEADLVMLYQPVGEVALNNARGVQTFLPAKRDGDWKWAPSIIVDTDDNLFNVSPLNQAFKSLGYRDMNGNLLPIGHTIGIVQDGQKKVLWKDGENGFSLVRNRQLQASYKKILQLADLIQCSTPEVEAAVRKEVTPRRSRVFPNMVRFDHYPQVSLEKEPDKVKILWQGGASHYEDWYPLKDAVGRLTKKYPEIHWMIWGTQYPWVNELIPAHRYTFIDWCDYPEYKVRLAIMGHDISIAPLTDNIFNRCRSGIKWYEASVLKNPAATLAQNTGPYKAEILDEQTGLLFNNAAEFEEKLSRLVEDVPLRKTLASNAKQWISENRDAMKLTPGIVQAWEQLREDRKVEQPPMSEAEWAEVEAQDRAEQEAEMGATDDAVPALAESG